MRKNIDIDKLSDEKLVGLVLADQELYSFLVKRYQAKLLRYAGYFLSSPDRAADVVQESLIKAFVNLRVFDRKKKLTPAKKRQ